MTSSLVDNHGNTSMSLDRQILQVAQNQLIYSHLCTMYLGTLALIEMNGDISLHCLTTFVNGQ